MKATKGMRGLAAGLLLGAAATAIAAARPVEGPRFAAIDIQRLVSKNAKIKEAQQLVDQWFKANQKLLDERSKAFMTEKAELDSFAAGSQAWLDKSRELRVKKAGLEADQAALQDELEFRVAKAFSDSHTRVSAACAKYMESRELDGILQFNDSPVSGTRSGDVFNEIVARTVVSHRKSIDVTDAILAILDAEK